MKKSINILAGATLIALATSCGSTQYLVTSNSENLNVLTQITESETTLGWEAGGGYDYKGILLTLKQDNFMGYTNIYKKDNPLSPAIVQITSGDNWNQMPTYCAAIDRIAYKKSSSGSSADIYMLPATKGTAMIPVTETSDYNEWEPSFSRDGSLLAYQKTPGVWNHTDSEIWLKNLKTGENMLLCNGLSPMISPDGTQIVFAKFEGEEESHIWVMNVDGSEAKQITGSKKELAHKPCWSPDGKYIVFQCRTDQKDDVDLYVVNADGTELKQLTNNECYDGDPYWAPDNMIYFTSDRGSKKNKYQIWRFNYIP